MKGSYFWKPLEFDEFPRPKLWANGEAAYFQGTETVDYDVEPHRVVRPAGTIFVGPKTAERAEHGPKPSYTYSLDMQGIDAFGYVVHHEREDKSLFERSWGWKPDMDKE